MTALATRFMFFLCLLALPCVGCATTQPPRELLLARHAVDRATDGPAKDSAPAALHVAQVALAQAEQSFAEDPSSQKTRDLAYVAERKAELADATATLAQDERAGAQAREDYLRTLELSQRKGKEDLSQARQFMAVQQQQLTEEQRARAESDRRARLALESLKTVAAVKEEARGLVITLNGAVLFASGKDDLLPIAKDRLNEVAKAIQDQPERAVVVEGHTDSVGAAAMNRDLSQRRAQAVREYLVGRGVPAERVKAVGIGPDRPIADNKSAEGRANNRRVEIILAAPEGAATN